MKSETSELASLVGSFIEYWGFKKIHGKIWCFLFLSEQPQDANFFIKELRVSKGLISIALKELVDHQVILKLEKLEAGTQLYEANPSVLEVIFNVLRTRERKLLGEIQSTFNRHKASLKKKNGTSPLRVDSLGEMIDSATLSLDEFLTLSTIHSDYFKPFQFVDK